MSTENDELVRVAYDRFAAGHDLKREALLTALRTESAGTAVSLSVTHHPSRRWLVRPLAAVAAVALIGVVLWGMWLTAPAKPAFALADLPERLMNIRSLHIRGRNVGYSLMHDMQGRSSIDFAVEMDLEEYYERPNRFYTKTFLKDRNETRESVSDGTRFVAINRELRIAETSDDYRLGAEIRVEQRLQKFVLEQLFGGGVEGYVEIGREQLAGVDARVFERRTDDKRYVVWLSATTGLPVRCVHYTVAKDGAEYVALQTDLLEFDRPAPQGTFDVPAIPNGFEVKQVAANDIILNYGSVARRIGVDEPGDHMPFFRGRFAFIIDDAAILLAWSHENAPDYERLGYPREVEQDLGGPVGRRLASTGRSANGQVGYTMYHLRDDRQPNGYHVRWTLAIPNQQGQLDRDRGIVVNIPVDAAGNRMDSGEIWPLRCPPEQLERLLRAAQQSIAPADLPADQYLTLGKLRTVMATLPK